MSPVACPEARSATLSKQKSCIFVMIVPTFFINVSKLWVVGQIGPISAQKRGLYKIGPGGYPRARC